MELDVMPVEQEPPPLMPISTLMLSVDLDCVYNVCLESEKLADELHLSPDSKILFVEVCTHRIQRIILNPKNADDRFLAAEIVHCDHAKLRIHRHAA
jgi:hypothetical protein